MDPSADGHVQLLLLYTEVTNDEHHILAMICNMYKLLGKTTLHSRLNWIKHSDKMILVSFACKMKQFWRMTLEEAQISIGPYALFNTKLQQTKGQDVPDRWL